MAAQQFLVKLTPYDVPNNIYVATVIDPGARPEHPIYFPPIPTHPIFYPPGTAPGDPRPEHPIVPPGGYPEGPGFGARPSHPIALPGDPWWGQDLRPEHPIVIPPEGEVPPDPPSGTGNMNCRWGYTEEKGWLLFCVYDPAGGGKPRPPGSAVPGKKK